MHTRVDERAKFSKPQNHTKARTSMHSVLQILVNQLAMETLQTDPLNKLVTTVDQMHNRLLYTTSTQQWLIIDISTIVSA